MSSVAPYQSGRRWTCARKADLIAEIRRRKITRAAALAQHGLTDEELSSWERRFDRHGHVGLKQTRLQDLRA